MNFEQWQTTLGLTDRAAADALRISIQSVRNYRRGVRPDQTKPVRIPDRIQTRMAALMLGEFA